MNTITIESASVEPLLVPITAKDSTNQPTDPTGDSVEFQTTADTVTTPTGTWVAGSWAAWVGPKAWATTPTVGGAGAAFPHGENDRVILWYRIGGAGGAVGRVARIAFN